MYSFCNDALKYTMKSRNIKKNPYFKKVKIMKSTSKIILNNLLIEDLDLILYVSVFNTTIEVIVKENPI